MLMTKKLRLGFQQLTQVTEVISDMHEGGLALIYKTHGFSQSLKFLLMDIF